MKINGFVPPQVLKSYTVNKRSEGVTDTDTDKQETLSQDSVEISQQAQDLQALANRAMEMPDIRMEKIAEIRERLDMYQIDLDQLADNIVREMVENKMIKGQ